jgi:hypothetical protein
MQEQELAWFMLYSSLAVTEKMTNFYCQMIFGSRFDYETHSHSLFGLR